MKKNKTKESGITLDEINNLVPEKSRFIERSNIKMARIKIILKQRYFGKTLESIGKEFVGGITRERIRQLESDGINIFIKLMKKNEIKK